MKRDAMSKLSASFYVLVLVLSALVVVPLPLAGETMGTNTIYVPVVSGGSPVSSGVTVTLTNVHTGEVIPAPYSSTYNLYVATDAPSGYYRVDVTSDSYYDAIFAREFRFEGLSPYTVSPQISLVGFDSKIYEWNITVVDGVTGAKIKGAKVSFYDPAADEIVAYDETNTVGLASVDMFRTTVMGDYYLIVQADNYRLYKEPVLVNSDNASTISLTRSVDVTGFVMDYRGPAQNVVAYLMNNDTSLLPIERVMRSSAGSFFGFDVSPGDYILCVDADGDAADMRYLTVDTTPIDLSIYLENQTQREEHVTLTYGSDFNVLTLDVSTVWSYDEAYPGLNYSDIGSLRMQIDLNSDTPDGVVDASEIAAFTNMLTRFGAQHVTTSRLLTVNDTLYKSATAISLDPLTGLVPGAVTATDGVSYGYTVSYTPVKALDIGAQDYSATAYAAYDTSEVNYTYTVDLPASYELVANSSVRVEVAGYLVVSLDPEQWVGGPEAVALTFEKAEMPEAGAGIVDSSAVYAVTDDGGNVTKYIVSVGKEVNFTAMSSTDPNGNPLTYTWDFGDGSADVTTANVTTPHTYASANALRVVTLVIEDVSGMVNSTEINVTCDGRDPVPVITVKERELNASNTIWVNQSEVLTFNATSSSDDAVSAGDGLGIIDWIQFDYGEGNKSSRVYWTDDQQNVSFSWADAGEYNLTLNVTDVVGHWKNTTIKVIVNDTTNPVATFLVRNATWGTVLKEQQPIIFSAEAVTDNVDDKDEMWFAWYFDDDSGAARYQNGTGLWNITHNFTKAGNYAVKLNVTDLSGNYHSTTKRVIIESKPRPDMRIDSISFDPETFTEDSSGMIIVNLTNRGSANATGVTLTFYVVNGDGTEEVIGTTTTLYNGTNVVTLVEVGGKVQVRFAWTPSAKGTYTIKVNVTSTEQSAYHDMTDIVDVKEAGWKAYALWGGVLVVLVVVPLLLYVRGRWAKRERKGPRREEKRSKGEED